MIKLYGLAACDSTMAAKKKLVAEGVEFTFHDVRKDGLDKATLSAWIKKAGWQKLLNKKSTTWKDLPSTIKNADINEATALALMLEHVTLIKRPVLEKAGNLWIGKEVDITKIK